MATPDAGRGPAAGFADNRPGQPVVRRDEPEDHDEWDEDDIDRDEPDEDGAYQVAA